MKLRLPKLVARACAAGACAAIACACSAADKHGAPAATAVPLPVATGDYPAFGHAADYNWIAGEVEKNLTCTYLRFGSAKEASWGGRIALVATAEQLSQLQPGDTIVVTGTLVALADGSCGSPSYVVSTIQEH